MTKERPILFSGAMVRAILDGRKTQTRRVVKPQPEVSEQGNLIGDWLAKPLGGLLLPRVQDISIHCPYGQPGDRLWVRETWQGPMWDGDWEDRPADAHSPKYCQYAADGGTAPEYMDADDNLRQGWRPSIHMPRWACRLELEITAVRVERLNDCSVRDAIAEGADPLLPDALITQACPEDYVAGYRQLWDDINGAGAWEANPWVWVVEFRKIEA